MKEWNNPSIENWCTETVACAGNLGVVLEENETKEFIYSFLKDNYMVKYEKGNVSTISIFPNEYDDEVK